MKYRDLCGESVSALGLGCMRLPTDSSGKIDEAVFKSMVKYAYENGVNYFDTAYMYHDGTSEIMLGKILNELGIRERVCVADKLPPWNVTSTEDPEKLFNEQLKKAQTEYFDFYILHNMNADTWDNHMKKYNALDTVLRLKKEGKIKHLGFSFHDDFDVLKRIIEEGGGSFEFCQIQLNYADAAAGYQAGIKGLEYAKAQGLDVIIMEPLKGGKLAAPSEHIAAMLPQGKNPVEYGLDFLWDRDEVKLVLSGMGSLEQLKQNVEYASRAEVGMLSADERDALMRAGSAFNNAARVNCTGCRYCVPCPMGIDIPKIFELYNKQPLVYSWEKDTEKEYAGLETSAEVCIECRKCAEHCPQGIDIPNVLKSAHKSLT